MIAGHGYILQTNVQADGNEAGYIPHFTPYIYFAANQRMENGSVYRGEGTDGVLMPGALRQENRFYETDTENTTNASLSLEQLNTIYTLSASNGAGELAGDYVVFNNIDKPMGTMTELRFEYKAATMSGSAMVIAKLNNVENADRYALTLMPETPDYGYTRMEIYRKEFEPTSNQTQELVWTVTGDITSKYPSAVICITAMRAGDMGVLVLEGEHRTINFNKDYIWPARE